MCSVSLNNKPFTIFIIADHHKWGLRKSKVFMEITFFLQGSSEICMVVLLALELSQALAPSPAIDDKKEILWYNIQ